MNRLERYEAKLRALEEREREMFRKGYFVKSVTLHKEIDECRKLIEETRRYYEPKPLSETLTRKEIDEMGIIPLMIEAHLVADFLTEVCYMIKDICHSHNLDKVSFVPEIEEILKKSDRFASFLAGISPELCELITTNETFNRGLHKKYLAHIETRMKHINKKER